MYESVAQPPWSDEQWCRIQQTVVEEAQRARVAAKFLPIYGPVDATDVAVPNIGLRTRSGAKPRFEVDSDPDTFLTTIAVQVEIRGREAADPELQAALTMFRRAANLIARAEDALMFNGQIAANTPPLLAPAGPLTVTAGDRQFGLIGNEVHGLPGLRGAGPYPGPDVVLVSTITSVPESVGYSRAGVDLIGVIVAAINQLEGEGYRGPYTCVLGDGLYEAVHRPTANLVLPRHTILPLLEDGLLLRSSTIHPDRGVIVSYESGQVEQVLAREINVRFLQVSDQPRFIFRVSERVALRVKDWHAVVNLLPGSTASAPDELTMFKAHTEIARRTAAYDEIRASERRLAQLAGANADRDSIVTSSTDADTLLSELTRAHAAAETWQATVDDAVMEAATKQAERDKELEKERAAYKGVGARRKLSPPAP